MKGQARRILLSILNMVALILSGYFVKNAMVSGRELFIIVWCIVALLNMFALISHLMYCYERIDELEAKVK